MADDPLVPAPVTAGAAAEFQAGTASFRSRTDVSFMAAIGAMVIGILLAVAAIIGAARARR